MNWSNLSWWFSFNHGGCLSVVDNWHQSTNKQRKIWNYFRRRILFFFLKFLSAVVNDEHIISLTKGNCLFLLATARRRTTNYDRQERNFILSEIRNLLTNVTRLFYKPGIKESEKWLCFRHSCVDRPSTKFFRAISSVSA